MARHRRLKCLCPIGSLVAVAAPDDAVAHAWTGASHRCADSTKGTVMKKSSSLKIKTLGQSGRLPRTVKETELKALAGGVPVSAGGTCTECNDIDC
jgi:hypothetical protein